MHEYHEAFQAPINADISIWRYMDMPKFLSMLEDSALHFVRSDRMSDDLEGSITEIDRENRHTLARHVEMPEHAAEGLMTLLEKQGKLWRTYTYLNCWHMNEQESAAMWSLYQSGQPQGIAIRSSYRRLSEGLIDPLVVWIGTVSYIDFKRENIPPGNLLNPFAHKRTSFEHEREIRAVHLAGTMANDHSKLRQGEELPGGPPVIPIQVDLDRLVEAVYVSPKAPGWFAEIVRKVLSRYSRNWTVNQSDLDADPIF